MYFFGVCERAILFFQRFLLLKSLIFDKMSTSWSRKELEALAIVGLAIEWLRVLDQEEVNRREAARRARVRASPYAWVTPYLANRHEHGQYHKLMQFLMNPDVPGHASKFKNFLRVDVELYQQLVGRLTPMLQKADTNFRNSISPGLDVFLK